MLTVSKLYQLNRQNNQMVRVTVLIQEPPVFFLLFVKNLTAYESFQSHITINKASESVDGEKSELI